MKTSLKLAGAAGAATVACAACCAVSIVPALLAGTSLVAIGGAASIWGVGLALLAVPVAGLYFWSRRRAAPSPSFRTLMPAKSGGCSPSCASIAKAAPVACSLGGAELKERVDGIRALARRSLRHAVRTPLTLSFTYGSEASEEVRDMVRREQACCPFLTFDLKDDPHGMLLTITAPKAAAETAAALFDHFAPEPAAFNLKDIA